MKFAKKLATRMFPDIRYSIDIVVISGAYPFKSRSPKEDCLWSYQSQYIYNIIYSGELLINVYRGLIGNKYFVIIYTIIKTLKLYI